MTNITRVKKGESIVSGKLLVTCAVTILWYWVAFRYRRRMGRR